MQAHVLPGDFAQVRRVAENEPIETAEGSVTASTEEAVTLGTREYIYADGWTSELIRRAPENLNLPTSLAEITAWLAADQSRPVVLVGKVETWRRDDTGELIPIDQILAWEPRVEEDEGTADVNQ